MMTTGFIAMICLHWEVKFLALRKGPLTIR